MYWSKVMGLISLEWQMALFVYVSYLPMSSHKEMNLNLTRRRLEGN